MNARPRHATPQLALAAGFLLAGLCSGMGGEALRRALPGPSGDLLATLGLQGFLFCLAFAGEALLRPTMPAGLALGPGRIRATTVLILVVGFVVLSHGVSVALAWLSLREAGTLGEIDRIVRASRAGPALPLVLLAIGVAPAFGEELMFRGLIQGGVTARWGPRIAIAVSAAAFAVLHGDWVHGSAAFLLGLYLASAVHLASSVRVGMVCHATNNTFGVLFPDAGLPPGLLPGWVLLTLLVLTGAAALLWAWRREEDPAGTPATPIGDRQ